MGISAMKWMALLLLCLAAFVASEHSEHRGDTEVEDALAKIMHEASVQGKELKHNVDAAAQHADLGEDADVGDAAPSVEQTPAKKEASQKSATVVTDKFWDMPSWAGEDEVTMLQESSEDMPKLFQSNHNALYIKGIDPPKAKDSAQQKKDKQVTDGTMVNWEADTERALEADALNKQAAKKAPKKAKKVEPLDANEEADFIAAHKAKKSHKSHKAKKSHKKSH